jgi:hypothetical protein
MHSKHLVLCEGELDALLLIRHGITRYHRHRRRWCRIRATCCRTKIGRR